ncbi:transposase [Curtobacterium sp. 20TX0008]|uniref:transposase n=1 Tax=Curtobacterium sp. 20TX0008 TaxID=3022018 RepID=UPI00232CC66A|nr:transposase [Curtobacterium sp. 20TX0008]MDB6426937.1 transposase [Curtobacterium sp. 20TX0008]
MEFADEARELLLVAPADFVRERTTRQRAVRKDDRALATRIGGLRKPAPAAWVVDLLAHEGALDEAVELGPAIRQAQADADPDEIRRLRRQRSDVVAALAQAGADLASDAGHPLTSAVLDQVRATIEAAMADGHAGAAVRSGLLVRPLESAGFDDVDLDGALADPDAVPDAWSGTDAEPIPITSARRSRKGSRASRPEPEPEPEPEAEPQAEPGPRTDPAAERRAAREAEATARAESRDADAALDAAEQELEAAEDRRAELERQLAEAVVEVERAERARDEAADASDRARDLLRAAQHHRRDVGR